MTEKGPFMEQKWQFYDPKNWSSLGSFMLCVHGFSVKILLIFRKLKQIYSENCQKMVLIWPKIWVLYCPSNWLFLNLNYMVQGYYTSKFRAPVLILTNNFNCLSQWLRDSMSNSVSDGVRCRFLPLVELIIVDLLHTSSEYHWTL